MNNLQKLEPEIVASLVIAGDLSQLSREQKVVYYKLFCERLGLDPLTQPFKILRLNGKEVLYCDRSGAQQLNKKHKVSHEIKTRDNINDLYIVTCRASIEGRFTESIGAVNIKGLQGDALANAMMKGETKAKRRATMDLLGLGMLDETETDTIPGTESASIPFSMEELRDKYFALLVEYEQFVDSEKINKLNPDNWKDNVTPQRYVDGITWLQEQIVIEKESAEALRTPHTIAEQGRAIRRAVDKDDFYEQRAAKLRETEKEFSN